MNEAGFGGLFYFCRKDFAIIWRTVYNNRECMGEIGRMEARTCIGKIVWGEDEGDSGTGVNILLKFVRTCGRLIGEKY